jgi:hypothetical protein
LSLTAFLATVVDVIREADIPFMLTGSLAAAYYGTPRATQDIDVVIDVDPVRMDRLVDGLAGAGLYVDREAAHEALEGAGQFNAIDPESGWKVDLIVRKARAFSETEFERRRPDRLLGVEVALTTIEDLIIAKLEWSELGDSELQRRDIMALLETEIPIDRAYLERWIETLGLQPAWDRLRRGMD